MVLKTLIYLLKTNFHINYAWKIFKKNFLLSKYIIWNRIQILVSHPSTFLALRQMKFLKTIIQNMQESKKHKIPKTNKSTKPLTGMNGISVSSSNSIILKRYKSGILFNAKIIWICDEQRFNEPKIANKCRLAVTINSPMLRFLTLKNKIK